MPAHKLVLNPDGLEAQIRLIPDNEELEEGQIEDEDEDEDDNDDEEPDDEQLPAEQSHAQDKNNATAKSLDGQNHDRSNSKRTKADSVKSNNKRAKKEESRISLFEMQSFLIALILPEPRLSTPPSWCRVIRCMRAKNVGIFLLDNSDNLDWIRDKGSRFTHAFKFERAPSWIERLTSVPLSRRIQDACQPNQFGLVRDQYECNLNAPAKIPRTSLLLSPVQMLVEGYPMPTDEHIRLLRSKYSAVDDESPLFAIDCEMCITDHSELTKISIVDEEMRVVYNELVKPEREITNYLTRYSGITRSMMKDVTTTIEDVHEFMRKSLPRDAILCGHSFNMDLAAMEIFHPFVIDTSVIYNRAGVRSQKPSLKSLAYELLGKQIQTADMTGHDSLEDAITTMELVKLKLVNGTLFGDSVAFELSQGIRYDSKTGITQLQIDKFIERHKTASLAYRTLDTTPGARCLYVHDKQAPPDEELKEAVNYLLDKGSAICAVLTSAGECYVKF